MANMSYCAFENTSRDMYDALDKVQELLNSKEAILEMSAYEADGLAGLLQNAKDIVNLEVEINDILETYDNEQ